MVHHFLVFVFHFVLRICIGGCVRFPKGQLAVDASCGVSASDVTACEEDGVTTGKATARAGSKGRGIEAGQTGLGAGEEKGELECLLLRVNLKLLP